MAELRQQGQSIWLDYIRRSLIQSGELKRLMDEKGVTGMTSNPTIFDKAIGGSSDYDESLAAMLKKDARTESGLLFEHLAIEDIRMATDALRPVWERCKGAAGYASLEVPPKLAPATQQSIDEARRLERRRRSCGPALARLSGPGWHRPGCCGRRRDAASLQGGARLARLRGDRGGAPARPAQLVHGAPRRWRAADHARPVGGGR